MSLGRKIYQSVGMLGLLAGSLLGCSGTPGNACGSNGVDAGAGVDPCATGGTAATGGATAAAGANATGGVAAAGGSSATGGNLGTGGSTCSSTCIAGATQCSGLLAKTCILQSNGCLDWSAAATCSHGGNCTADTCLPTCTLGDQTCNGAELMACDGSSKWQTQMHCAQSCDQTTKSCVATTTCSPGAPRCGPQNEVQVCNAAGTAYLYSKTCAVACDSGLCTGACTPGEQRCNGKVPQTCDSTGGSWTAQAACSTYCYSGRCVDPQLSISNSTTATLQGEVVVDGTVAITNSSTLTVPSGSLTIRAKSFILDSTSSIVVQPTGNDPRGRGANGGTNSASCSYCGTYGCSGPYSSSLGASGGGYGTPGTPSTLFNANCNTNVTFAGGVAYSIADNEFAPGSAGGNCVTGTTAPGGLGGGMLVIIADVIVVDGSILATGQAGLGCAGGGSGGLVVLQATNNLSFTGIINTTGGAGGGGSGASGGGNGVAKLMYGNQQAITGTFINAKKYADFIPPQDVGSATHPDQSHWYNDNYPAFEVAWNVPFSSSDGYWYLMNSTLDFVPGPGNSALYTTDESLIFTPTQVGGSGTRYIHLSSMGPSFAVSTIQSHFRIQINSAAPAVTSSTHPSDTTWVNNPTAYMTWTIPSPQADADIVAYYWLLDTFQNTIPGKTDHKIVVDKTSPSLSRQLVIPNLSNGMAYFHIISEDTMGYLTKVASTRRVLIRPDPGMGGVSGMVTAGAVPLQGATITLNRGYTQSTTASSGQFTISNVYAISYEIRASKTGYQDQVKSVQLTPSVAATVNFNLTPLP